MHFICIQLNWAHSIILAMCISYKEEKPGHIGRQRQRELYNTRRHRESSANAKEMDAIWMCLHSEREREREKERPMLSSLYILVCMLEARQPIGGISAMWSNRLNFKYAKWRLADAIGVVQRTRTNTYRNYCGMLHVQHMHMRASCVLKLTDAVLLFTFYSFEIALLLDTFWLV